MVCVRLFVPHRLRQPLIDGRAAAGRNRPSRCLRQRNLAMPHEFTGPGGTYTIFEPELASDAPAFSDEALALRFADQYAKDLRYVAAWGRWLHWSGTHWRIDNTLHVFDLVRALCREAAAECDDEKLARILASAKTVAAVERLAKADRRLAATMDQWDLDPLLLNMPDGTIDLRTGIIRPHRSGDYLTKVTAVAPGGDCPTWLAFLERVTAGDPELEAFLQRMFGYALTGDTSAHGMFFLFGTGANGKSVCI